MKCSSCKFNYICGGRIDESVGGYCKRYKSIEKTNEEYLRKRKLINKYESKSII